MEVTLGGDRLGSGNKQTVEMHNYQMSSFNLEQDFKSSLAPGVLYPFMKLIGTNHGTFDIDLDSFVRTLPTRGPLFGSYKLQIDLFEVPMRLYQAILHNNAQKIGMKMNQVYLPKIDFSCYDFKDQPILKGASMYSRQINDSSLAKYLGLAGIGTNKQYKTDEGDTKLHRKINAIPFLAYYDIFKNYYANKQEENAYVITPGEPTKEKWIKRVQQGGLYNYNWSQILAEYDPYNFELFEITQLNQEETNKLEVANSESFIITLDIPEGKSRELYDVAEHVFIEGGGNPISIKDVAETYGAVLLDRNPIGDTTKEYSIGLAFSINADIEEFYTQQGTQIMFQTDYVENRYSSEIKLTPFALQNIDDMRMSILSKNNFGQEFIIGKTGIGDWNESSGSDGTGLPYSSLIKEIELPDRAGEINYNAFELNGLCVKTYQSDLFNNWLDSEWIEGEEGIAALTAISTQDGKFTVDSFIFAEKLYDIYNRIATGGGSYEDWQDAVYGEGAVRKAETPMYIGGMAAEIMFEEVISSSETNVNGDYQALGTLGGKGTIPTKKDGSPMIRGGRNIHVKLREPGYIMGIVSLTPRICYSQGNDWDLTELDTMDDLHKPGLDGIGFQDLIIERMAWWNTRYNTISEEWERDSAGKQTAWINYQTAIDKCYGDFAKQDGYSFMVLNRNYEMNEETMYGVNDITTYIDPKKFNYAFAYDELAAQNFWIQIHSKVIARRKMGAQQIPNL